MAVKFIFALQFIGTVAVDIGESGYKGGIIVSQRVFFVGNDLACPSEGHAPKVRDNEEDTFIIRVIRYWAQCERKGALREAVLELGDFSIEQVWGSDFGILDVAFC